MSCHRCLKDVVALRAEDHDALVEVVVLHGGGGVEDGERRVHLGLEGVVGAAVVQVVAQARHQQAEDLEGRCDVLTLNTLQKAEGVPPSPHGNELTQPIAIYVSLHFRLLVWKQIK